MKHTVLNIKHKIQRKSSMFYASCSASHDQRGMTFVELIVVMAIFAVIASIVLFRFDLFDKDASFSNLAQDIALKIVSTQKAAISGVDTTSLFLGTAPSYGIHFYASSDGSATLNKHIIMYADLNHDELYTNVGSDCPGTPTALNECISDTVITGGYYVSQECYILASAPTTMPTCTSDGNTFDIFYTRPFPDATIISSGVTSPSIPSDAYIQLSSPGNVDHKTVIVTHLGQVRVCEGTVNDCHY